MKTYKYKVGQPQKIICEGGKIERRTAWSKEHFVEADTLPEAFCAVVFTMANDGYKNYVDYEIMDIYEVQDESL